jgi:hypothetical protein
VLICDVKRNSWVTYNNFELMYDCVYDRMVHAGVAAKLPGKVFRDRGGRIVDEEDAFGLPTEYVLTHPLMVVYVDKTGSNTNLKMDGHIGGELFVLEEEVPTSSASWSGTLTSLLNTPLRSRLLLP